MRRVLELFSKGRAPIQIDRALFLKAGTAHDIIVEEWRTDSVFGARMVRRG